MITIIIPTYNEGKTIENILRNLREIFNGEVIVSDSSTDNTPEISRRYAKVIKSNKGRASQMNSGAEIAKGDIFLFLHADTELPSNFKSLVEEAIARGCVGGAFGHSFVDSNSFLRMLSWGANVRSRLFRRFYGDQAIFVKRDIFHASGGFNSVLLMEDVDFSRRIRKFGRTCLVNKKVKTSDRRFMNQMLSTFMLMVFLQLVYIVGMKSSNFHRYYHDVR